MWKSLKRAVAGPELPSEPTLRSVPTHSRFGTARFIELWYPRSVTVEVAGAPRLTVRDEGLPRRLATSVVPPRILATNRRSVTLMVENDPAFISAGKRGLRRRTYRCDALVRGVAYRLIPTGPKRATLFAGEFPVGQFRTSKVNYPPETIFWEPTATPQDVVVGMLLGSALGIGANGFLRNLLRDLDFVPTP
ncbi:hypothetical protein [Nocardia gipuzkoensis]